MKLGTAWQAGRLGSPNGRQRLLFGQMYEDSEIEQVAFQGKGRVFCVASAGTTAIRLADGHQVVACDVNPAQLAYAEARARGAAYSPGDADCLMNFARRLMPLAGWRAGMLREFLALADLGEQKAFWREHLDTRRFRRAFDLMLSPIFLRAVYAPQFLSVLPAKFGAVLRKRLERGFGRHANASNPYARALLLGEVRNEMCSAASNIQFVVGDAASFLESCSEGFFDGFALSNILDGAEPIYRARLSRAVRRAASENAIIVLRSFAEPSAEIETNHAERDRAMLWGVVDICSTRRF